MGHSGVIGKHVFNFEHIVTKTMRLMQSQGKSKNSFLPYFSLSYLEILLKDVVFFDFYE